MGRRHFEAEDDRGAIRIAGVLQDACSDISARFELWRGAWQLTARRWDSVSAAELTSETQERLAQTEEALRDSRRAIARSKRLLEKLSELRKGRADASTEMTKIGR